MRRLYKVLLLAPALMLVGAAKPDVYDSGRDSEAHGSGSAKGSYSIVISKDKLKINLDLESSKQGLSGRTRGYLAFAMLDSNNKVIWSKGQSLTVGARVPQGKNKKNYTETFTVFGPPAKSIILNGGSIAFNVSADVSPGSFSSFSELTKSLKSRIKDVNGVIDSLSPGQKQALNGWIISKVGPAAAGA